jgi:hypothetical protein
VNPILGGSAVSSSARPARPPRWWPGGLAWALWVLTLLGLVTTAWLDQLLRQAGRPELSWLGAGNAALVGAAVIAATIGALVASRRPFHPVGWLLVAMGLALTLSGAGGGYKWYGLVARPGTLPAASYLVGFSNGLNIVSISCAGFVLLLTPTGSLPSRRWRWWARVAAAAAVVFLLASVVDPMPVYPEYPGIGNPFGVPALAEPPLDALIPAAGVVVLVALVVAAGSLVGRFRRARGSSDSSCAGWLGGRCWPRWRW